MLNCLALPWALVNQAPLSRGFPKQDTGVGCHFLLQGIFPFQGLNPDVLHCRQILYCLSHQGSPKFIKRRYYYLPSKRGTLKSEFSLRATYLFVKLNMSRKTSDRRGPHEWRSLSHRVWHSVGIPLVFLAYEKLAPRAPFPL